MEKYVNILNPTTTNNNVFNLRYPWQYYDAESKLHYNINRYYDPATGRYTQSDPIGLSGGINTYTYVGGNTVRWSDAEGLRFFTLTTIESAKRNTTIDDAVRAGALTRSITMPALITALSPSLIGLGGSAISPSFCSTTTAAKPLANLTNQQVKDIYGKNGVELFRVLFKDPSKNPGLTIQQLEAYKELALRAIEKYNQSNNLLGIKTQTNRIDIINRFLP